VCFEFFNDQVSERERGREGWRVRVTERAREREREKEKEQERERKKTKERVCIRVCETESRVSWSCLYLTDILDFRHKVAKMHRMP